MLLYYVHAFHTSTSECMSMSNVDSRDESDARSHKILRLSIILEILEFEYA